MSLISCPYCSAQVSDKAVKCPKCGKDLEPAVAKPDELPVMVCEECGQELEPDATACPNCGCPVQEAGKEDEAKVSEDAGTSSHSAGRSKKKLIIAIIVIAAVMVLAAVGAKVYSDASAAQQQERAQQQAAQEAENYKATLQSATNEMLNGAAAAEKAGGMIGDVWSNTINKKSDSSTDMYTKRRGGAFNSDFNTSISTYMSSNDYKQLQTTMRDSQNKVDSLMKDLTNPPSEYDDAYDAAQNLYDSYNDMLNLALNPSGSLMTYSSNYNDADSAFSSAYKKMKTYL